MNEINLPSPNIKGKFSLEECIYKRKSVREFLDKKLTIDEISQLLWAAQGKRENFYRTVPSAGATYPLEIRVAYQDGVFRYFPQSHKLIQENECDIRKDLCEAALSQKFIENGCNFIISAVFERTTKRYGERGIMYVHMEAGHSAQNICLQAVALNLGSVCIGAFYPDKVKNLLNLAKNEIPIYIITVGYSK